MISEAWSKARSVGISTPKTGADLVWTPSLRALRAQVQVRLFSCTMAVAIARQTVAALREALPYLKSQGYKFVTISELIEAYPYQEGQHS